MGGRAGQAKTRAMASEEAGSRARRDDWDSISHLRGRCDPGSHPSRRPALDPPRGAGQGMWRMWHTWRRRRWRHAPRGSPRGARAEGLYQGRASASSPRRWRILGRCTNSLGISSKTQQPRLVHRRRPRGGGRRRRRDANPTGGAGLTGKKGCGKWRPRTVAHEGAPRAGCRGCSRGVARSVAHRPSDVHAVSAARKSTTHTQRYLYRAP